MNLLEGLNDQQLKAVTHGTGPLLIVAGAGTGKTMALTRRYVRLLEAGGESAPVSDEAKQSQPTAGCLTPDNILALTFTEKAAGEMEDRILQLLPNGTYDFWISTFHGFCQRILEKYGLEIGLPTHFKLLTETDAWLLLKRRLNELPLDYYRPLGNPVKFLAELLKHFSRAKDEGVSPERYLEFAENAALDGDTEFVTGERKRLKELADCYFTYRRILREEGALDFGDLIMETLRLLKERPRVLKELRKQFKYVLVDEFQDTNWAQYEMIKLLSGEAKNLTVVGDDDQSIYKFRGASLANILQFRDDFPDAVTVMLTQNYRSHQEILDTAYRSIEKNNPNRLEIRLADTGLSKKLVSARGGGGAADVMWYKTLDDEAEGVALRIRELKDMDPELTWNDIAILSRSNDGAEPFIRALERHGIPFRFYALRGLYSKPVIVDLMALFSLLDGYHESSAVWRAMTAPCYSFPPRDISSFIQYANRKGISLWEAVRQASLIPNIDETAVKRAAKLVAHAENLAETARRERPLKVFQLLLEKTEFLAGIMQLPEQEKLDAIGLLNSFASRIKRYEQATLAPTLRGFLDELKTEIDSGEEGALRNDPDEGPELVKVLTVHASKGLEFKHVFIVSMVDQRFPTRPRGESIPLPDGLVNERLPEGDAHVEEERRLFYVAVTRAKDSVTFTGAEEYGGTRKKKPSVFLGEAGFEVSSDEAKATSEMLSLVPPAPPLEGREMAEREVFELKRRFSFTQLAAFRSCPLQYKFAHIYRIPILGSYHKSFGNSVHHSLKAILDLHLQRGQAVQGDLFSAAAEQDAGPKDGFRVTLDEALAIFETNWIDEWYPDRERHDEYKKVGREAIKHLIEDWTERPPEIAFLEQPFDWRLGDHSLKGSVDRIDRLPQGGYAIYDYKTSEPKTADDLAKDNKEQLWIYQLAMEEKGLDVRKLAYLFVRTGEIAEVDILQGEKREAFREEVLKRMQAILISRFEPNASPFVCRFCDFKNICEFRRL